MEARRPQRGRFGSGGSLFPAPLGAAAGRVYDDATHGRATTTWWMPSLAP